MKDIREYEAIHSFSQMGTSIKQTIPSVWQGATGQYEKTKGSPEYDSSFPNEGKRHAGGHGKSQSLKHNLSAPFVNTDCSGNKGKDEIDDFSQGLDDVSL